MKKKTVALLLALVLVVGCSIGGTVAWLIDETATVTNTFTSSNIDITLTETDPLDFKMVPGGTITKDPKVTVEANSEACWLFVKLVKSANYADYLADYAIDTTAGWKLVSGQTDVYYIEVDAATAAAGATYQVLAGNQISVLTTVDKDDMDALESDPTLKPTLALTAYAIQSANLKDGDTPITTAEKAWELINPPTP